MRQFDYIAAPDVAGAVAVLADRPDATVLAGGTNLVDLMRLGVARPGALVDVRRSGSTEVADTADGALRIGASVPNSDLAAHPLVRERFPVLSEALLAGASGQLRNMATTGGNLLQHTRCVYFQDVGKPCNRREPGSGCPAVEGDHRNLAVLGASENCVATHPSDMAVAMAALDAVVHVQGASGTRTIPIGELHRLPGDTPEIEHTLGHDEIVTAVEIPALPAGSASTYRKVRDRASYAFALASVAAVLTVRDGRVDDVRIGLGAMAAKPWRATQAEAALRGQPATAEAFGSAIDAELAAARPLRDNAFKIPLVRSLVVSTLLALTGQNGGSAA